MSISSENGSNFTALLFRGVSKNYGNLQSTSPFTQFNLQIQKGEKILLAGVNGVGKTTLLKLAAGYLEPNSGTIEVFGKPIKNQKKQIGMMLQHHFLYWDLTALENLEFNASIYGVTQINSATEIASQHWGLGPFLTKKVGQLSNGQRTLLALARANIHSPSLLLLDEPHVYLDEKHLLKLEFFLTQSKQSIILTSQSPQILERFADRVIHL